MSNYGKYNLYAILGLPVIAALGSIVVFGFLPDTIVFVFGVNLLPMLIGGLVAALLLRFAARPGSKGQLIAILPSLVPAVFGIVWYAGGVITSGSFDAGREYFAVPLYLVMWVLAMSIVALIGCLIARSSSSSATA